MSKRNENHTIARGSIDAPRFTTRFYGLDDFGNLPLEAWGSGPDGDGTDLFGDGGAFGVNADGDCVDPNIHRQTPDRDRVWDDPSQLVALLEAEEIKSEDATADEDGEEFIFGAEIDEIDYDFEADRALEVAWNNLPAAADCEQENLSTPTSGTNGANGHHHDLWAQELELMCIRRDGRLVDNTWEGVSRPDEKSWKQYRPSQYRLQAA